jgi:hypothetical protein
MRVAMHNSDDRQPTRLGIEFDAQMISRVNCVNNFALRNVSTWVKLARHIAAKFADQKPATLERSFSKRQLLNLIEY